LGEDLDEAVDKKTEEAGVMSLVKVQIGDFMVVPCT